MQPVKTEIACSLSRQSILMVITKHHSALMGISLIQMVYLTFKVKLKPDQKCQLSMLVFFLDLASNQWIEHSLKHYSYNSGKLKE